MPQGLVYAVHGFLGEASDWNTVKSLSAEFNFRTTELFKSTSHLITNFENYVDQIINEVSSLPGRKYFLGYSLGGRIGLHILEKHPSLFDHYLFLSTNPGMPNDAQVARHNRLAHDQNWAQQITKQNWLNFNHQWNAQSVFEGSLNEPERKIESFDLLKLQNALLIWSLANQKDFSEVIKANQAKLTWVVGEKDLKYSQIAEDLKQKKILLDYKRISSSHRIWLDQPEEVSQLLKDCFDISLNPV